MVDAIILFLAFIAGALAFFTACGFVVLPAYLTHYFGKETKPKKRTPVVDGIRAGILVTLGFLTVFGIAGTILTLFGRGLVVYVPWITMALGVLLIIFGALSLAGRHPAVALQLHQQVKGERSFYHFGIVYGIASFGCTLPIFLSLLGIALASDAATGFLSFILYALGMGAVMLAVSIGAALTKGALAKRITSFAPLMQKLSAVFIIAVGIYLIYYQLQAGFLVG